MKKVNPTFQKVSSLLATQTSKKEVKMQAIECMNMVISYEKLLPPGYCDAIKKTINAYVQGLHKAALEAMSQKQADHDFELMEELCNKGVDTFGNQVEYKDFPQALAKFTSSMAVDINLSKFS